MLRLQKNITDGLRLGELLAGSGLVDEDALEPALRLATASRLPLGRVLVSTKHLTGEQVERIVLVQKQARAGGFNVAEARRQALLAARCQNNEVFQQQAQAAEAAIEESFIEEDANYVLLTLLSRAGVVAGREVADYLEMSIKEDVPCGRMLVLHRRITPSFRRFCLQLLGRYRQGQLSLAQAVEECRRVRESILHGAATELQEEDTSITRLGQILLRTEMIDEIHLYDALEISLNTNRQLGQVLVDSGLVSADSLQYCLEITESINQGNVPVAISAEELKKLFVAKVRASLKPVRNDGDSRDSRGERSDKTDMRMAMAAC